MKRIGILAGVWPEYEEQLHTYLSGQSDLELLGCVHDGAQLINQMESSGADVVVVELVLPNLDGFGVLDHLSKLPVSSRPPVLVLSPTGRDDIVRGLLGAGADYVLLKPFPVEVLGSRVRQLALGKADRGEAQRNRREAPTGARPDVARVLQNLGISNGINGFGFLCRAVSLVVDNEALLGAVTKTLYPTIARESGSTSARVERSIRHAVESVWARGNKENLDLLFGLARRRRKPTNSEFIATIAASLRESAMITKGVRE